MNTILKQHWKWLAGLVLASSMTWGEVTINFKNPERFIDIRIDGFDNPEYFGKEMTDFLQQAMKRHLPEGLALEITFTQVDLAGAFEPWRGPDFNNVRILKDIYAPRLEFSYALLDEQGNILKQGETRLIDINYLENVNPLRAGQDILYHEKKMMERWVRRHLTKLQNE